MPYMIISGGLNTNTLVGGKNADLYLMAALSAWKVPLIKRWYSDYCPQEVLNILEENGWKVVAMCYSDRRRKNTWTLRKEATPTQ